MSTDPKDKLDASEETQEETTIPAAEEPTPQPAELVEENYAPEEEVTEGE